MADGTIDAASTAKLRTIGSWYNKVKSALCAPPCPLEFEDSKGMGPQGSVVCTGGGRELNLILLKAPRGSCLRLNGIDVLPEEVTLLNTGRKLPFTLTKSVYALTLPSALRIREVPVDTMPGELLVIRLKFKDPVIKAQKTEKAEEKSGILKDE
jgi:hypothetical protein